MTGPACRGFREKIPAFLDGELDRGTAGVIAMHCHDCRSCANFLETLQGTDELLKTLPVLQVPAEVTSAVFQRIKNQEPRTPIWGRLWPNWPRFRFFWIPAGAVAAIGVGLLFLKPLAMIQKSHKMTPSTEWQALGRGKAGPTASSESSKTEGKIVAFDAKDRFGHVTTFSYYKPVACKEDICLAFFEVALVPRTARPGQLVLCSARYSFEHDKGGKFPVDIEEMAVLETTPSSSARRTVKAKQGENLLSLTIEVPARTSPGFYPMNISVRSGSVVQNVVLHLTVTR